MKYKKATRNLGIILLLVILVALFPLMFNITKEKRVGISWAAGKYTLNNSIFI